MIRTTSKKNDQLITCAEVVIDDVCCCIHMNIDIQSKTLTEITMTTKETYDNRKILTNKKIAINEKNDKIQVQTILSVSSYQCRTCTDL